MPPRDVPARLQTLLEAAPIDKYGASAFDEWVTKILALLEPVVEDDPDLLVSLHAEMRRHPALWEKSLMTVNSAAELERVVRMIPFARFAFAPRLGSLERKDAVALAASPSAANLIAIRLEEDDLEEIEALEALVASSHLQNLEQFEYLAISLGADGFRALTKATRWPRLRHLRLSWNTITVEEAEILSAWPQFSHLTVLDLDNTSLSPEALAAFRHANALEVLNLEANNLGDQGARALAANPSFPNLKTVYLSGDAAGGTNDLTDDALVALAGSSHLTGLQKLFLEGNNIGSEGVMALAASPHLRSLEVLALGSNDIGDDGVIALAQSSFLETLWALDLGHNPISDVAVSALADSPHLSRLTTLNLIWTRVSAAAVKQLRRSERLPNLTTIQQGNVWVTGEEASRRWPD
ncbi:MAG: hypothetical protein AAFV53_10380 [Myxococcota bacterium]